MTRGTDAPRNLLAPFQVELLSVCCTADNPAFESWIFLTVRRIFLLRAADGGGPEAPVISTSGSLPMEESEENLASSSASWCSSAGAAASFPGSPSSRGAGDQYSKTLAYRRSELCHNPTGALIKIEQNTEETTQNAKNNSEDSRRLTASVGHLRQWAFEQPLSRIYLP